MNTFPMAPQEGEVTADVLSQEEDASYMSVARPEEQNIDEADKLPGYIPMVSLGLEAPNSVPPEEEDDTEVSVGLLNPAPVTLEVGVNTKVINMDCNYSTKTMAEGLACSVANCRFVTTFKVPNNRTEYVTMRLMQLQMQELKGHYSGAHGMVVHESFVSDDTDATTASIAELDDATGKTVPKGWTKSSSRSKKSKHRKKSGRSQKRLL